MSDRPAVWKMVKEAIESLGGTGTYGEIRDSIKAKYGDVNEDTITAHIIVCSVNHPSRVHYTQNQKARQCVSQYDFLFHTDRGKVAAYNPDLHGRWEICCEESGKLVVSPSDPDIGPIDGAEETDISPIGVRLESHLRDFIAANLASIKLHPLALRLYEDSSSQVGVEYPTEVGPIDILALDSNGDYVVFELKLSKGPDRAVGQILRYMGWVKKHLAGSKNVAGVIVAREISEKLKYAVSIVPNIALLEYKLRFDLHPVKLE